MTGIAKVPVAPKFVVAVVDDDPQVLESLESLLESNDYVVHLFSSGTALLDSRAFGQIDCLISDVGMPGMDGFELRRLASAARPGLPVILITGRHEFASQGTAPNHENHSFFLKPFNCKDLLDAISKALPGARRDK